jgi:hypothetical protein
MAKKKTIIGQVKMCHDAKFKGIDCLELEDKYGFEGYYMGDLNHPDPRPAHAIWIDKKDAEKLFVLFNKEVSLLNSYQKQHEEDVKIIHDWVTKYGELGNSLSIQRQTNTQLCLEIEQLRGVHDFIDKKVELVSLNGHEAIIRIPDTIKAVKDNDAEWQKKILTNINLMNDSHWENLIQLENLDEIKSELINIALGENK